MLIVEENYVAGVPQTAVAGFEPRGAAWHWSAGGSGREGWQDTIRHLVNTRYTVNASYHGGFWCEHDASHNACRTVIQWIVRTTRAAHSLNPANAWKLNPDKPRAVQEARFAEVHRILGRDNDPNADCLALAYAGMPADLERDLRCPVFRADVQNVARQLVAHPAIVDRPHFGHGWIQPLTRYEMDVATDFIGLLYGEEEEMTWVNQVRWYKQPVVVTFRPGTTYRLTPDLNETDKYVAAGEEPRTVIGEVDGLDFGAGPLWLVIPGDGGVPKVAHSQDELARAPLSAGGISEADMSKRELAARDRGFLEGRDAAVAAGAQVQPS